MWLINTTTLELHEFVDAEHAPPYAVLSHCWGSHEHSFKDFRKKHNCSGAGYEKIDSFCAFTRKIPYQQETWDNRARFPLNEEFEGIKWAWVDTVCIDKKSSAELTEAINSMFKIYALAQICLAHLADVAMAEDKISYTKEHVCGQLRQSRWFTRGWTLQELIAPSQVVFVDRDWQVIRTKNQLFVYPLGLEGLGPLTPELAEITGIPAEVLSGVRIEDLRRYSVAERMRWAAGRHTTRVEDVAYSLLGLFGINMPLLYGEGRNAFSRLQDELVDRGTSNSIFAWRTSRSMRPGDLRQTSMLSRSPVAFAGSPNVADVGGNLSLISRKGPGYELSTPRGSEPTIFKHRDSLQYVVRLRCCQRNLKTGRLEPVVMLLQNIECGHFTRVVDESVFTEHDVSNVKDYITLSNPQTLYIHASKYDVAQCINSNTGQYEDQHVDRPLNEATKQSPTLRGFLLRNLSGLGGDESDAEVVTAALNARPDSLTARLQIETESEVRP